MIVARKRVYYMLMDQEKKNPILEYFKYATVLIVLLTGVFFMAGRTYNHSIISEMGASPGFFTEKVQDVITDGYKVILYSPWELFTSSTIFYGLMLLLILFGYIKYAPKIFNKVKDEALRFWMNILKFYIGAFLLFIAIFMVGFGVTQELPAKFAKNVSKYAKMEYKKLLKSESKEEEFKTVYFKKGSAFGDRIIGIEMFSSPTHVALQTQKGVVEIPMSEISLIVQKNIN